ncbi:hypothetical protein UlMin_026754 [Ulmus minor]
MTSRQGFLATHFLSSSRSSQIGAWLSGSKPHQVGCSTTPMCYPSNHDGFLAALLLIGLAHEILEDLYHLIKKAMSIRKHLERNMKDKDSKFRLILVESRIHRLARYYKKTKKLPLVFYTTRSSLLFTFSRNNRCVGTLI